MRRAGVAMVAALALGTAAPARADQTSVGLTFNGTTGQHVVSERSETVPFVPLPTIEIERAIKRFRLHAEVVPPIGPVSLGGPATPFGNAISQPRLSVLSADAFYELPGSRSALGIGETVINQLTRYSSSSLVQSSRVVGARYAIRSTIFEAYDRSVELRGAFSPSMHGVQYSTVGSAAFADPEHGSLVDASIRETRAYGRIAFVYGLRYLNYAAAYDSSNRLADRNHLLMPFMGWMWNSPNADARALRSIAPRSAAASKDPSTTFGITEYGVSGYESYTHAYTSVPKEAALVSGLSFSHRRGPLELRAEIVPQRSNADLFGTRETWSASSADVLYHPRGWRVAFGVGDELIKQRPLNLRPGLHVSQRGEGVRFVVHGLLSQDARGQLAADLAVVPYEHNAVSVWANDDVPCPGCLRSSYAYRSVYHGALLDGSLAWTVRRSSFALTYGVRYVHQVLDLASGYGSPYVMRDATLMPFLGVRAPIGSR